MNKQKLVDITDYDDLVQYFIDNIRPAINSILFNLGVDENSTFIPWITFKKKFTGDPVLGDTVWTVSRSDQDESINNKKVKIYEYIVEVDGIMLLSATRKDKIVSSIKCEQGQNWDEHLYYIRNQIKKGKITC